MLITQMRNMPEEPLASFVCADGSGSADQDDTRGTLFQASPRRHNQPSRREPHLLQPRQADTTGQTPMQRKVRELAENMGCSYTAMLPDLESYPEHRQHLRLNTKCSSSAGAMAQDSEAVAARTDSADMHTDSSQAAGVNVDNTDLT